MSAYEPFGGGFESTADLARAADGLLNCLVLEGEIPFCDAGRMGDGRAAFSGLSVPFKLESAFLFGVELVR